MTATNAKKPAKRKAAESGLDQLSVDMPGHGVWTPTVTCRDVPDATWASVVMGMVNAGAVAYNMDRKDKYGEVVRAIMDQAEGRSDIATVIASVLGVDTDVVQGNLHARPDLVEYPPCI